MYKELLQCAGIERFPSLYNWSNFISVILSEVLQHNRWKCPINIHNKPLFFYIKQVLCVEHQSLLIYY